MSEIYVVMLWFFDGYKYEFKAVLGTYTDVDIMQSHLKAVFPNAHIPNDFLSVVTTFDVTNNTNVTISRFVPNRSTVLWNEKK